MKQHINEAKRMQFLAGIINESQQVNELNDAEQDVVDAILGEGISEGKFNPKEILNKLISIGKKGLLTAAILSSVLTSCNFDSNVENNIKSELQKSAYGQMIDSTELSKFKEENTAEYEQVLSDVTAQKDTIITKIKSALESEGFQYDLSLNAFVYTPSNSGEMQTFLKVSGPNSYSVYKKEKLGIPSSRYFQKYNSSEEAIKAAIEAK